MTLPILRLHLPSFALSLLLCTSSALPAETSPPAVFNERAAAATCEKEFLAARYAQALPACQAALQETEKRLGPDDKSTAHWLNRVGRVLLEVGKYSEAEPYLQRSLRIRERALGPEHPDVAESLSNLAALYHERGRYAEEEPYLRRSLGIREKALGPEHPSVAATLNSLAVVCLKKGRYTEAEPYLQRSLRIRQKAFGPEHSDVAQSLSNLAGLYRTQGRYSEAEPYYQRSLRIWQKVLGPENPDVASTLSSLAGLFREQGRITEAEPYHLRSLRIMEKALGPEHPDVAEALNNLAGFYHAQGRYAEAEPYFQRSLRILEKALGPEHPDCASALNNLAALYGSQGRYAEAEPYHLRSLRIWEKALGPEHPDVALVLNNLAGLYRKQGRYAEAEPSYQRSLRIFEKALGPEHPSVATALSNVALLYSEQGRYAEAEPYLQRSLRVREKVLGPDHPDLVPTLNNLAFLYRKQGRYAEVEPYLQRGLRIGENALGPEHPEVVVALGSLAISYAAQGQLDGAVKLLNRAAHIREKHLRNSLGEIRVQALLDSTRKEEELLYGLLLEHRDNPAVRALAMTTTLLRKGRALEAAAATNRLLHREGDAAVRQRILDWQSLRQQREALLYGGLGKLAPAAYQAQLRDLGLKVQSIEAQLATELPEIRSIQPPEFDDAVAAVAAKLPRNGALIEIVLARSSLHRTRGAELPPGPPHYIALLLFPDRRIASMDLGTAAEVDARSRALREVIERPGSEPRAAAQALFQQVFQPLLKELGGITELYLSLDGILNIVPFDALHDGTEYLLGRYRFHYLTSGRDLLRASSKRPSGAPLLLANPDFGPQEPVQSPDDKRTFYQKLALQPLPGTQREAERLGSLLGVPALLRGAATEAAVRGVRNPRVLHIATHGLFLRDVDLPAPLAAGADQRSAASPTARSINVAAPEAEQLPGGSGAMNRSALALAFVQQGHRAASTASDGLLTAEEARSLDLEGTQLVVLSACDTGQGALSAGQGVYGLRRAFLVAGAETLVTSLWRVHDEVTGELMAMYYGKLLDKRKPGSRLGAMVEAMQELRTRPGRAHPYYWAPFLVIGQDGPLRPNPPPSAARAF
jgi:CHAT domain-containing protein/tetratricopeptide (TPR) repeat protein